MRINSFLTKDQMDKLIDNTRSDKNTIHSYLNLYDNLLGKKRETAKNVLEVGIQRGGSIKLWRDYFTQANVYGIDIMNSNDVWDVLKNDPRIFLYTSVDAYISNIVSDVKFDFMLDDGPHSLESMKKFIELYTSSLTEDGILIIEDVQEKEWFTELFNVVPENLKKYVKYYDLRKEKKRYDDLVFTIDKS